MNQYLSQLTLVIPTYERQEFALRIMHYWANKGPHLIVLDGSSKPINPARLNVLGPHIQYLHRPVSLYQRLSVAQDLVKTEFVALAIDDEFYVPSAVEACIYELEKDDRLIACCGRALGFLHKNSSVYGIAAYPKLEGYAINANIGKDRLVYHMSNYVISLLYAICRTVHWKISWKYILLTEFPFFAAGELQFEMLMSYAGRSKVIPELMWLRANGEAEAVRGTDPSLNPESQFTAWWEGNNNLRGREEFIFNMSEGFKELASVESRDLRGSVMAGVQAYNYYYTRKRPNKKMLNRLAKYYIPSFAKPYIKKLNGRLQFHKSIQQIELLQAAKVLEESGVLVDYSALEEIQERIIQFHNNRNRQGNDFAN